MPTRVSSVCWPNDLAESRRLRREPRWLNHCETMMVVTRRNSAMRSMSRLMFVGAAVLGTGGCNTSQQETPPSQSEAPRANPMQGAADWRQRMQANHNADSSVEQQTRRLTQQLNLTPQQQTKVRQLSRWHNQRIQAILETAPPSLTYQDFQTQVHAISGEYHDSVNAILSPHQLDLMKSIAGQGRRRPRP